MKQKGLWPALEQFQSPEAVLAEWQNTLGSDFTNAKPFLLPTTQQSRTYPCTNRSLCGCYHEVIVHAPERIVAACRCDIPECKTIPLQPKDFLIYTLNWSRFLKAIRNIFDFNAPSNGNKPLDMAPNSWQVGFYGESQAPVYYSSRPTENEFIREVEGIISASSCPFILLMPTLQFIPDSLQPILQRQKAMAISLSATLTLKSPGKFILLQSIQSLLKQFKKRLAEESSLEKVVEGIGRDLKAIAQSQYELETENEELKTLARDGFFNFLIHVEAEDFRYFIAIWMYGDRAKAARELNVKQSTFYDRIKSWPSLGPQYKRMHQMIGAVKKLKTKKVSLPGSIQHGGSGHENENPQILNEISQRMQKSNSHSYPDIFQELFNAILEMNENNWPTIQKELIDLLKEELPQ